MSENEMQVVPASGAQAILPVLDKASMQEVLMLLGENLGANFDVLNLPRIRMPAGGAMVLRLDGASGEETPRSVDGVIAGYKVARLYWQKVYGTGGGKRPPDCTSIDGFTGVGNPGGNCQQCPFAQFGTATNPDGSPASGQACKEIRQVLFLTPGDILPHLLSIPPTSLKAFDQYTLSMLAKRTPYWGAITSIGVERARSDGGIEYGRLAFRMGERLSLQEREIFRPYHQQMKELLTPSLVDAASYEILDPQPGQMPAGEDEVPL